MAVNTGEIGSNEIKIAFYSKNLQKSPIGWGLRPQTPSVMRLNTLADSTRLLSLTFALSNY